MHLNSVVSRSVDTSEICCLSEHWLIRFLILSSPLKLQNFVVFVAVDESEFCFFLFCWCIRIQLLTHQNTSEISSMEYESLFKACLVLNAEGCELLWLVRVRVTGKSDRLESVTEEGFVLSEYLSRMRYTDRRIRSVTWNIKINAYSYMVNFIWIVSK